MINTLAAQARLTQFIGGNSIRSDSGLAQALVQNTSQVLMIDEFGHFLAALNNPRSPSYLQGISSLLMTLYSSSGGAYNHGSYADSRNKPISIIDPNLCIYGTTTETKYAQAMRKDAIDSGDLNRFIVVRSPNIFMSHASSFLLARI